MHECMQAYYVRTYVGYLQLYMVKKGKNM